MKTSELTGLALDWAIAKCEERTVLSFLGGGILVNGRTGSGMELDAEQGFNFMWHPSTNWAQGGPIIERESICVGKHYSDLGSYWYWSSTIGQLVLRGTTPLIAAMRTYVASKLGDDIEVPEELINGGADHVSEQQ